MMVILYILTGRKFCKQTFVKLPILAVLDHFPTDLLAVKVKLLHPALNCNNPMEDAFSLNVHCETI